jgi:phosphate transport system protein
MVEKFHVELEEMKQEVLDMGHLANSMLKLGVKAVHLQDRSLGESIVAKKTELAHYDMTIEDKCFRLIALYQPMAHDMRVVACSLKMITYLYRIGRYGKDIAKLTRELSEKPHIGNMMSIPTMAEQVCGMVDDCLKAYESEDISSISDLSARDDGVDAMRQSEFRECITHMMEDPKNITRCTYYVMIARYLERCGDHACKIGEKIHYMATGERIEIK